MRFFMRLSGISHRRKAIWKGKGTAAATSNLHPAGVYHALHPYRQRRWALTPPLHNHLLFNILPPMGVSPFARFAAAATCKAHILQRFPKDYGLIAYAINTFTQVYYFSVALSSRSHAPGFPRQHAFLDVRTFLTEKFPRDYPPTFFLNILYKKIKFC